MPKKFSANEVNPMQTNKTIPTICSILAVIGLAGSAFAQGNNDFFGSSVVQPASPGGATPADRPPGVAAAEQQALKASASDLTSDEKRMQKKYKANLRAATDLVTKAEKMIADGTKKKDDKAVKKGQVLKLVAEKRVNELKQNNPLPDK
jgi:hypothetical protein